ncbi:MAG TPA: hypothetical protein VGE30_03365 [Candidatus Saccharimonadales bacterium]
MTELFPNGEKPPIPRIRLEEGPDFIDAAELYQKIVEALVELGHDPQTAVLCGHNQDDDEGSPRLVTYGMTLTEIERELATPVNDTPYDYALDVAARDETPIITVYDGRLLRQSMEHGGQYESINGNPIESTAILDVEMHAL